MKVIDEIQFNWMLEARSEDSNALFYHPPWLNKIKLGRKIFVVGRKGTGKTAIAEHIKGLSGDSISHELAFSEYPIEYLKDFSDSSAPNGFQYTSLWELLIYTNLCKMLLNHGLVTGKIKAQLEDICPDESEPIYAQIQTVIKKAQSASIPLGIGSVGFSKSTDRDNSTKKWGLVKNYLKDIFFKHAPKGKKFYLTFDSLDEGYRDISTDKQRASIYFTMLACLFRAARVILDDTRKSRLKVFPVVFIRSDIYAQIKDNDKNKWRDLEVRLEWRIEQIRDMLAYRISRTINPNCKNILPFSSAWNKVFENKEIEIGKDRANRKKYISTFDYITTRTYKRPRDYVAYIQLCCEVESEKGNSDLVLADTVKKSVINYSHVFVGEINDEQNQVIPGFSKILGLFSELGRSTFHYFDFVDLYESKKVEGEITHEESPYSGNELVDMLFEASIIGNAARGDKILKFKFGGEYNTLNKHELLTLHMGMRDALLLPDSGRKEPAKIRYDYIPIMINVLQEHFVANDYPDDLLEIFDTTSKTLAIQVNAKFPQHDVVRRSLNNLSKLIKKHVSDRIDRSELNNAVDYSQGYVEES
ncbi:hypothetical protein HYN73_02210 [Vibrio parahaemolyticus]|uniref:P-loop ATPase, Sll1717 family n=3 Tax=Vibrio parahaemolyticus TaxID=670 RepID=UPI0004DABB19|nr:hypothetical protein [Vibrio parahaemolyticus]EGR1699755.1 hypothetical protein [Vibrio parahaemolyticus]ELA9326196.1 hypothetical protein [Vibrio parahaemolyticus]ELB2244978.1 hypothetical protein [Vibrio parahaemolyticus]MBM5189873.1 hypothetical protein [Vibrio parahaemolyticus]MBM5203046.1 hypothetical protein [Vibrio parahaemolyticus]